MSLRSGNFVFSASLCPASPVAGSDWMSLLVVDLPPDRGSTWAAILRFLHVDIHFRYGRRRYYSSYECLYAGP